MKVPSNSGVVDGVVEEWEESWCLFGYSSVVEVEDEVELGGVEEG